MTALIITISKISTGSKNSFGFPSMMAMTKEIAAAASKYGDYFTGSTSSVMYVDEFSLVYDPSQLTEEQLAKVKYK